MTTELIGYHIFEIEVDFHKGVILVYLEVGVVGCMTFNDNLLVLEI